MKHLIFMMGEQLFSLISINMSSGYTPEWRNILSCIFLGMLSVTFFMILRKAEQEPQTQEVIAEQ